ncbi:MAG: hypothetical protein R2781_00680 [Flavobacteriaceae bacterium]
MKSTSFRFLSILFLVLVFVFGIHLLALDAYQKPLFAHKIILSYWLNFVLAAIVLVWVQRYMKEGSAQAGFIFLLGSGLKFLIFFLVFYPSYKANGVMETIEFVTFFTPYAVSLGLEVFFLSKQLNNQ